MHADFKKAVYVLKKKTIIESHFPLKPVANATTEAVPPRGSMAS